MFPKAVGGQIPGPLAETRLHEIDILRRGGNHSAVNQLVFAAASPQCSQLSIGYKAGAMDEFLALLDAPAAAAVVCTEEPWPVTLEDYKEHTRQLERQLAGAEKELEYFRAQEAADLRKKRKEGRKAAIEAKKKATANTEKALAAKAVKTQQRRLQRQREKDELGDEEQRRKQRAAKQAWRQKQL